MGFLFKAEGRKAFRRQLRSFWQTYKRNKIGMVGLAFVLTYVFVAVFAPWLTPYDPIRESRLAEGFAMPEWVTVLPQYSNLPRTTVTSLYWEKTTEPQFTAIEWGKDVSVTYNAPSKQSAQVYLTSNGTYTYSPPQTFYIIFNWKAEQVKNVSYSIELAITGTNGSTYRVWSTEPSQMGGGGLVQTESTNYLLLIKLGLDPAVNNLASMVFSQPGDYSLTLHISFKSTSENAYARILFTDSSITIPGLVWGILGTDHLGGDLFSQLIYGSQISLEIGLSAALVQTALGVIVGVMAGYLGGGADELIMRTVDVLICLPVLPLLLALIFLFGTSIWYIVILIAVFGWLGLSRVVRSQVLYLREMSFVECAKASGASKFYIMFKHLIPNVFPITFASLVLSVPGAIITESVLSFLGFGDPRAATWGRMLNHAFGFGAFGRLAWWWILPPGLAITFICLSFVFIGHAVDEMVNPRLRRRE
jgi:peptide/nickel transport system permease protein